MRQIATLIDEITTVIPQQTTDAQLTRLLLHSPSEKRSKNHVIHCLY